MEISRWKKLKSREYHKNPFWTYKIDDFVIPSTGFKGVYYFVHTNGSSMIIPVTKDNNLLLVNQYRYLNKKISLEFPCGGIKTGSNPDATAMSELREETGFSSEKIKQIGKFCPFNGVTDEYCFVYFAENLTPDPKQADDSEELSLEEISISDFESMISKGKIFDGMTLSAWALGKEKILKKIDKK
jgi:ADP-ribose pyrophosphatase